MSLHGRLREQTIMAVHLPDARELPADVLEALRLRALHAVENLDLSEAEVAAILGVRRETVCRWWAAYLQGGLDALPQDHRGRPPGAGRALTEAQGERIRGLLSTHRPDELGIAAPLWTRRAVADLIEQEFGIRLAVRTVGNYLGLWGLTPKRPSRHARDQDPDEVRQWVEETYPAIEGRAEEEGADIYWCDEVGAAADAHPARGYAPRGERATIEVPGPHIRAGQISAISNGGKVHFMTYTATMNAALFLEFLRRLLRGVAVKVFLIVDRLRAHATPEVAAWVAKHQEQVELF